MTYHLFLFDKYNTLGKQKLFSFRVLIKTTKNYSIIVFFIFIFLKNNSKIIIVNNSKI